MSGRLYPVCLAVLLLAVSCGQGGGRHRAPVQMISSSPASGSAFLQGVSAQYCGAAGDVFILAGGANFPDVPASEGGRKKFHDDILVLGRDLSGNLVWKKAGALPVPAAYGASAVLDTSLLIAGGASGAGSLDGVYELFPDGDSVRVSERLPLPFPLEQCASAVDDSNVYLAGGLSGNIPNLAVLASPRSGVSGWEVIAELPEPLVQPVAFSDGRGLYVWGGYNPERKAAVGKGYFLDFSSREWTPAPSPDGRTLTGAGGAAGPDGRFYVAGGVDRDVFTRALGLGPEEFHAYMLRKPSYYRFCDRMYAFDPRSGEWSLVYRDSRLAKAGAATGFHGPDMIIAGGEVKPGIRTPEAYQLSIGK